MRFLWRLLAVLFVLAVLASLSEDLAVGAVIVVFFFVLARYVARELDRR